MKIAVVGTGYVGLVTGTCLAETGNTVTCVDIDQRKVQKLQSGQITIYEPGLEKLFDRNLKEERLLFTTSLAEGIQDAEIIFLALPTPPGADGSADLRYVLGVADDIGKLLQDYKVIIDKSTVPVGTAEKVQAATGESVELALQRAQRPGELVCVVSRRAGWTGCERCCHNTLEQQRRGSLSWTATQMLQSSVCLISPQVESEHASRLTPIPAMSGCAVNEASQEQVSASVTL